MKKGVSLIVLVIVIIVMVMLASIVFVESFKSANDVLVNAFAAELFRIQSAVDDYYYRSESYPVKGQHILDVSDIPNEFVSQFSIETITENKINLDVLDLALLGISNTKFGNGSNEDIYVLSQNTGKVYYLNGFNYVEKNKIYYTLIDELYSITGMDRYNDLISERDIKVEDVIFTPNRIEPTNEPIYVVVKVPTNAIINKIIASNDKSIGEITTEGLYNIVIINEISEDKTGNYTIQVSYTYNGIEKTAIYEVTNFDNILPKVSASEQDNAQIKTININATDDESGISLIKYENELVSDKSYFEKYGTKVTNNQFVVGKDSWYTIWVQDKAGNVTVVDNMPESWKPYIIGIVDNVPIPKGFVASQATGENKEQTGLVIYQGTEPVTDANVEEAKKTRNQYVWVPVESKYFASRFVRKNFGLNDTTGKALTISNVIGTNQWEVELNITTNIPLPSQSNNTYMSTTTLSEVQEMYASVKEYGGFYIARYEAGIETQRTSNTTLVTGANVHSKIDKIPYTFVPWGKSNSDDTGGAVQIARGLYPKTDTNYGVVSTLTYGVQWNATMIWWLNNNAVGSLMYSTEYGNYSDTVINSINDLRSDAKVAIYDNATGNLGSYVAKNSSTLKYPKEVGTAWGLTTGALEITKVNNIYDMAGNVMEWTMEGSSTNYRARFGGYFNSKGAKDGYPVAIRSNGNPSGAYLGIGFRTSLYIKI